MPPFGASGSSAAALVPPADVRRHRRDLWGRVGIAATVAIVCACAGGFLWSAEQVLDRRGVQTEAVVVETHYERRLPDEAVVHYRVDGLLRQATLTVGSADDFEVGQRITVEYDPDDSTHARPLEGWSPTYRTLWWFAAIALLGTIGGAVWTKDQERGDARVAGTGPVHQMHCAPFRRRRWLTPQSSTHLVGLWPEGHDRTTPAPLSVEVKHDLGPARPGPVTVIGRAQPGDHVVLRIDGETVWTRGVVKAGLDPKAKPVKLPWPLKPSE